MRLGRAGSLAGEKLTNNGGQKSATWRFIRTFPGSNRCTGHKVVLGYDVNFGQATGVCLCLKWSSGGSRLRLLLGSKELKVLFFFLISFGASTVLTT